MPIEQSTTKTFDDNDNDNVDDIVPPSLVQESGGGVCETRSMETLAVKINGESKRLAEYDYSRNKTYCRKWEYTSIKIHSDTQEVISILYLIFENNQPVHGMQLVRIA